MSYEVACCLPSNLCVGTSEAQMAECYPYPEVGTVGGSLHTKSLRNKYISNTDASEVGTHRLFTRRSCGPWPVELKCSKSRSICSQDSPQKVD